MKFLTGAVLLAAMALTGCMGPEGNPNGQPYANEPGGALAAPPLTMGTVSYDPKPEPYDSFQSGPINPPPPLPPPPAR